jgi:RND family efflux transporter MFP subunit
MNLNMKTRKRKLHLWMAGTIVLAVILSSFLSGCETSRGNAQEQVPALVKVPVASPLYQPVTEWDEYTGRFKAMKKVEVRARVGGYIDEVRVNDGELVEAGDVLFVIDRRPYRIALSQAEAQLDQAKAVQRQSENAFNRVKELKSSKAISTEEYDQREQALYAASGAMNAAEANVAEAELNMQWTQVRAPISGKVSEEFVTEGNLINGGSDQATLLTTIVSLDPIYFYFEGSETALLKQSRQNQNGTRSGGPNPNMPIAVKLLDEDQFRHKGILNFMDNEVDFGTGTFRGRAVIPNPDFVIASGMFGTARVFNDNPNPVLLIPDEVIANDQSQKIVYVLSDGNKVAMKPVTLGPLHNARYRVVRSGLEPDDQVIVGNIQKIRPQMEVEPEVRQLTSN